jgi:hypothetical protein
MADYAHQSEWNNVKSPGFVPSEPIEVIPQTLRPLSESKGALPSPQLTPDQFVKWVQHIASTPTPEQWAYILDTANNVAVKGAFHAG